MGLGSIENILVCKPRADGGPAISPCGSDSNVSYQPEVIRAYLVDQSNVSLIDHIAEPFDYGQATALWSFGFTSVLLCWFVARGAGTLLGLIRKG